jgi:AAA domain
MEPAKKHQIVDLLIAKRAIHGSYNKMAVALNISPAQLNTIIGKKWETNDRLVSDQMWAHLALFVGLQKTAWEVVTDIPPFQDILLILNEAQTCAETYGYIAHEGGCKTEAARYYTGQTPGISWARCEESDTKKSFLLKVCKGFGISTADKTMGDMLDAIEATALGHSNPLIILDELDKVSDKLLYFFISFYNRLEGKCGIVIFGTIYLQHRIIKGVNEGKKGFPEFYSRMGRRFMHAPEITTADVVSIIKANGITDNAGIKTIIERTLEELDYKGRPKQAQYFDLRRLKRCVQSHKRELAAKNKDLMPELFEDKKAA